jgi:hypothetical protein
MTTHESFLIFITLSYLIYISLGAVTGFVFGVDCGLSQIPAGSHRTRLCGAREQRRVAVEG